MDSVAITPTLDHEICEMAFSEETGQRSAARISTEFSTYSEAKPCGRAASSLSSAAIFHQSREVVWDFEVYAGKCQVVKPVQTNIAQLV